MTIYLAARYSHRERMLRVADVLTTLGHEVTSRWIRGDHQITDGGLSDESQRVMRTRFATEDIEDLRRAECCISFTEEPRSTLTRGGRHVEFGAAIALGKRCIVVGPRENVFHCMPQVEVFDTLGELFKALERPVAAVTT